MIHILRDTREQDGFTFTSCKGILVSSATLATGDYSISGLEDMVAVERKNPADFALCMGRERERFCRELIRARGLRSFCVVVEMSWRDVLQGRWGRSQLEPASAAASVQAMSSRWGINFVFAGSRDAAEAYTAGYLEQFAKGLHKKLKAVENCLGCETRKGFHPAA